MRVRKCVALGGAVLIFLGCLVIYRMADYTLYLQEDTGHRFQSKQSALKKPTMYDSKFKPDNGNNAFIINKIMPQMRELKSQCKRLTDDINVKIQMAEVYGGLKFDNIDGGAWKQGWNIETNPNRWNSKKKLKVFIVPHSHNDPGWLKTFEDYYISETRNILSNMLKKLTTDSRKKFIWAEISFFSLWWDELSEGDQEKVRRLVEQGQLEIVTGGWVMNDEANTHYYSILTQLTEGHQWIKANFKVNPKNGWTIDPFGESSVMPYLLKKMGLEGLVIQRVHYSVKKYFAQTKNLEFRWRQSWDDHGSNDLLTHMTPFYSYDIPHTCGPDPKICCQFDFKRLPGNGLSCPWKIPPKIITKKNVAVRAQMLLDQYRKKSELYRTNVVLVPLGDDFRYQDLTEWDDQFENYYKILYYINTNPDLYAEVKFGTLSDFFNALKEESAIEEFPTLVGDFFTYADRDDHYWSGYYTSRPFYKRMDRILIGYHRAAEILFALGWSGKKLVNSNWLLRPQNGFAKMLRDARRSLSLFQHHDGITGTAKDNVMEDYARKMLEAINYSQHIIQQVSYFLLCPPHQSHQLDAEQTYFEFDDQRKDLNALPQRKVLILGEGESKTVIFFNSLTYKRIGLATLEVFTTNIEVLDFKGNSVPCQISPIFSQDAVMDDSRFEISFAVEVPPLGLVAYKVVMKRADELVPKNSFSKIKIFNGVSPVKHAKGFENFEMADGGEFSIENHRVLLTLSENGLLKSVTDKKTKDFVPLHLDFVKYLARPGRESSGAYLFLPEGEASIIRVEFPLIRIYSGPLFTRVEVKFPNVKHFLHLYNSYELENLGIEIINVVNIVKEDNYELAMRLTSHVKNGDYFYTDLNGFQVVKRKRFAKLPIQGNFYPMPTASFIEDESTRLTVLSAQPLGVSSLKEGQLEILQDRRLKQDDNRGLGQGVLDNKITPNLFRILVEKRIEKCEDIPSLSRNAYLSSQSLLYPIIKMIWKLETQNDLLESYSPVTNDLSVDLHLISVRTFDEEEIKPSAGLVFHRPNLDSCFEGSSSPPHNGTINMNSFLPHHFGDEMKKTSLSFLYEEVKLDRNEDYLLCYLDFLALVLS